MRKPLPDFLAEQTILLPVVVESKRGPFGFELLIRVPYGQIYRIYCTAVIDYAIRPYDPRYLMGGPPLQWSADDPKLLSPCFQEEIAWAEAFDEEPPPPRRFQIITINQSYVIAEYFEIEVLPLSPDHDLRNDYPRLLAEASAPTPPTPIDWNSLEISFKHLAPPEPKTDSDA